MALAQWEIETTELLLDEPSSIGKRIRELRQARGWTFDDMTRKTGLSRGTLWEAEHRKNRTPWFATLEKIAAAFEVPVDYLQTGALPASEQSLADFTPELYGRAQGIDDPEYLSVLRKQVEILKDLSARKRDEPKEDAAEE